MKWLYSVIAGAVLTSNWSANAHDFWIESVDLDTISETSVSVIAKTGHGVDQSNWPIVPHRITSLKSIGPDGIKDHQSSVANAVRTGIIEFTDLADGAHILAIESGNSYSELSADSFADYVEEEGILPIKYDRELNGRTDNSGKELYSRRGKTLVRIGEKSSTHAHITQPIGMTLEITPLRDPFSTPDGSPLQVQVHYRGTPLDGATIHVTKLDDPEFTETLATSSDGVAVLSDISSGRWLFHTVWASPANGLLNDADYITVFSSLTFDIGHAQE